MCGADCFVVGVLECVVWDKVGSVTGYWQAIAGLFGGAGLLVEQQVAISPPQHLPTVVGYAYDAAWGFGWDNNGLLMPVLLLLRKG